MAAIHDTAGPEGADWRLWLGVVLSGVWLWLGLVYIGSVIGFGTFLRQGADVIGGFLEGGFAPLAFLWLVIGFFLQRRELADNTRAIRLQYTEMRRTAEQAEIQARAIQANEMHARQDTFMEIATMVQRQLGGLAGLLYVSILGRQGSQQVSPDQTAEMWARASADPELFSRALLGLHFSETTEGRSSKELFLETPIRREHTDSFIAVFARLIRSAEDCDPEGLIADAIQGSANGLLFAILRQHRDGIPAPNYIPR